MILEYYSMPHGKHKPVRANPSDAGLDLRFNPQDDKMLPVEIQPGGSVRDEDVIAAANEKGMTMVFTKNRHFKH